MEYIEREAFLAEQRHLYCENCARRKNGKGKFVYDIGDAPCRACDICDVLDAVEDAPAADAIEQLEKALNAVNDAHNEGYDVGYWAGRRDYEPKWIPVTERLPERGTKCLVTRYDYVTSTPFVDLLWFDNSWWDRLNSGDYAVTHWMPLPQPPEEV